MRISVKVKANAKIDKVEKLGNGSFSVSVKPPAIDGRANQAVMALLSEYFGVPKRNILIARGLKNKMKIIEIL
jgi:uncharacterized protein YggU (UPF0235/DUF167 family)